MDKLFCYHLVVMFFATIAILFLWVSFTTPGWLAITFQEDLAAKEYTVSSLNRSLYYDILCPQELKTCEPCKGGESPDDCLDATSYDATNYNFHYTWVEALTKDKEEWLAWRIIMTIVIVAALVGWILAVTLVCCLLRPLVYRSIATTAFFAWLIAAILVWIPVGMVADMHLDIDDAINKDIPHDATLHVPYSVVIAAFGGLFALITAILLIYLMGLCRSSDKSSGSRSDTDEIFSERSKRTATMIQDGRYYGPYPYYNPEPQIVYRDAPAYQYGPPQHGQPQYITAYNHPGSQVVEEEVLSEYPYYKGDGHEHWYDNKVVNRNNNNSNEFWIPRV